MEKRGKAKGPLSGVRVVDLTAMVMGPYATQIMADNGADIIKVESPQGDDMRYVSAGPERGLSGVFVNTNRGKRSIMLDLRSDEGKAALRKLIETADVFVHSMRSKAIARLGFDYACVAAIKPDIIYVNGYGYGRRGPYADKPAYDDTIQAECGLPSVQEMINGEPGFVGTVMADKISGLHVLYATLMAMYHRAVTGQGQEVEVPMFESMASFMLAEHANGALFTPPAGPAYYPRVVSRRRKPYRTKDGYLAALVYNDKHWASFMNAVRPDWADPKFDHLEARAAEIDYIYGKLADTFAGRTTAEWIALLDENHIPAAPLRTIADLMHNEHLEAVGFFETVDSDCGPLRLPGNPVWFSKTPGAVQGPAPRLGAHNDQVFGIKFLATSDQDKSV
jgi:crotonobetainyl-CoA:carnitine CoA-transferase CaiB-like acyl-CoA transferase